MRVENNLKPLVAQPRVYLLFIVLFGLVTGTASADTKKEPALSKEYYSRFFARNENYVIWQESEGDEAALEAHYSFSYRLFDCNVGNDNEDEESVDVCRSDAKTKFYVDFSYTGEFDFYIGTRDSGPVINRLSNPAFHFIWEFTEAGSMFDYFDIGLEHRSNGQVVDANASIGVPGTSNFQFLTQVADNNDDREYFDTLSREADYVSFLIGSDTGASFNWSASAKYYINDEANITWGKLAGTDTSFADYDILRLMIKKMFTIGNQKNLVAVEYVLGEELLDTDSINVSWLLPLSFSNNSWNIPLLFRAHTGPMDRLSNYTEEIDSIGVGIALAF